MSGIRSVNRATDSQSHFSRKRSRSSILEVDSLDVQRSPGDLAARGSLDETHLKDPHVFREKNSPSSWRSAKRSTMQSCTATGKIQKQKYTSAAAASLARNYPSS
jgi:hypothetical protein